MSYLGQLQPVNQPTVAPTAQGAMATKPFTDSKGANKKIRQT